MYLDLKLGLDLSLSLRCDRSSVKEKTVSLSHEGIFKKRSLFSSRLPQKRGLYLLKVSSISMVATLTLTSCISPASHSENPASESPQQMARQHDMKTGDSSSTQEANLPSAQEVTSSAPQENGSSDMMHSQNSFEPLQLDLTINGISAPVTWENNATVAELAERAHTQMITATLDPYQGSEFVGRLSDAPSPHDSQVKATRGDIVLYQGTHLVIILTHNTWNYTKLGHIDFESSPDLIGQLSSNKLDVVLSSH